MASLLAGAGSPFGRLWRSYERCLQRRPIATQSLTSGALWALGDVLAQKFTSDSKQPLDARRAALTGVFGAAVVGPAGTFWYQYLDRFALLFGHEGTLRFLLAKLAADSTVWNIWYMSAFFLWGELVIERGTLHDFAKQMEEEFVPTYLAEVAAWPPIMAAIFTRLPTAHHLLAVNLVTVLDVVFLALIRSGAFSLGGSPASVSSSQGEELCDEPSDEPMAGSKTPSPPAARGQRNQQHQQQQYMVPALASMHSTGRGAAGASSAFASSSGCYKQQASLIEQWVLPEHREEAAHEMVVVSTTASSSSSSRARAGIAREH